MGKLLGIRVFVEVSLHHTVGDVQPFLDAAQQLGWHKSDPLPFPCYRSNGPTGASAVVIFGETLLPAASQPAPDEKAPF